MATIAHEIDTLHPSLMHNILCALPATDRVRLAACSKALRQQIMYSACPTTRIPIMRERLKDACWSLIQAGYCVHVRNALASHISSANPSITFQYNQHEFQYNEHAEGGAEFIKRIERYLDDMEQTSVSDIRTFGLYFDKLVLNSPKARLTRSKRPILSNKGIEKHFAQCAEALHHVTNTRADYSTSTQLDVDNVFLADGLSSPRDPRAVGGKT